MTRDALLLCVCAAVVAVASIGLLLWAAFGGVGG